MAGTRSRSAGALEALVMRALWNCDAPMTANAIQATFEDPAPAQTTVLTVLSRLEAKQMVQRQTLSPRKVRFRAAISSAEAHAGNMVETLNEAQDRSNALLAFTDTLSETDLDVVLEAIAARRARGADSP